MQAMVQKWGNSLALRIPKSFAVEIGLANDTPVNLSLQDGKLIVAPIIPTKFTLDGLLADVTEDNLHGEVETGGSVGAEVW